MQWEEGRDMGRLRKEGNEFFSFDVDFFSDKKIKILKARYGADGITLYIYLLCEIYKNGFYLKVDEDFEFIASDDLNMNSDKVKQVLTFLLERSMFDKQLFQSDAVLTSAGIQRRYQLMVKSRAVKNPIKVERYWLLSEEETETFIKVNSFLNNSENHEDNSRKNDFNSENNDIKEKKGKEKNIDRDIGEKSEVTFADKDLEAAFQLLQQERDNALKKVEQMEQEKVLTSKGVRTEDLDYVMFKISKMVDEKTDFKKAAEKFLKENPRFTGQSCKRIMPH